MGVCKCPNCGLCMCDAELYYRIGKIHGKKTMIKCPKCSKKRYLGKMLWEHDDGWKPVM